MKGSRCSSSLTVLLNSLAETYNIVREGDFQRILPYRIEGPLKILEEDLNSQSLAYTWRPVQKHIEPQPFLND